MCALSITFNCWLLALCFGAFPIKTGTKPSKLEATKPERQY